MNAISATLARIGSRRIAEPSAPAAALRVSRLEAASPEFARLKSKRNDLLAEQVEIAQRARALAEEIRGAREKANGQSSPTAQAGRVAALLGEARPEPSREVAAMNSLDELEVRRLDIDAALAVLDKRISAERMAASAIVRDQVEPDYRRLVAAICEQLIILHGAVERYEAFTDGLNADEVAWSSLVGMPPRFAGAQDRYSHVAQYLREAAKHGFISARKIPEAIR